MRFVAPPPGASRVPTGDDTLAHQGKIFGRAPALTRPYAAGSTDAVRLVGNVTAILAMGAGVIHVSAASDHENLPVMMIGFAVVATLQIGLGALLLWRRPSGPLMAAALAMTVASIGIWLVSRTAGLPFLPGGHMEPIGFKDGVTVLFEVVTVPLLVLLNRRDLPRVALPSARLSTQVLAAAGAGAVALMVPALVLDGGRHHSHEQALELGIHHPGGDGHAGGGMPPGHANAAGAGADHAHGKGGSGSDGHGSHDDRTTVAMTGGAHSHAAAGGHTHARAGSVGSSAGHDHGSRSSGGSGHRHSGGGGTAHDHSGGSNGGTAHGHGQAGSQDQGEAGAAGGDDDGDGSDGDAGLSYVCGILTGGTDVCVP